MTWAGTGRSLELGKPLGRGRCGSGMEGRGGEVSGRQNQRSGSRPSLLLAVGGQRGPTGSEVSATRARKHSLWFLRRLGVSWVSGSVLCSWASGSLLPKANQFSEVLRVSTSLITPGRGGRASLFSPARPSWLRGGQGMRGPADPLPAAAPGSQGAGLALCPGLGRTW